jgi:HPr kinase/phosphorylase
MACFLDVLGMGVLITGDSGVGKSELGLELISRGHGLVADDVVEVSRIGSDTLEGRCPELLKDFLEVRGLGLLNIRTVFGETACRRKMRLKLIVHLQKPTPGVPEAARLPLDAQTETILGVPVRRVTLPVAAGTQPGRAAGSRGARHRAQTARHRQHAGVSRPPGSGASRRQRGN